MSSHDLKRVGAAIESADRGGFTAIASTGSVDRDGEVILPGCFAASMPASIPVHVDHNLSVAGLVGRGRPYYVSDELRIDAEFSSTPEAQTARQKAAEGILDSLSIVFRGQQWEQIGGVRTCVKAELLAADLVTVPSNRDARVLSVRGGLPAATTRDARRATTDALLVIARAAIAESRAADRAGQTRSLTDHRIRRALGGR